jgi:hypothetical protein
VKTARQVLEAAETERDFQAKIVDLAKRMGWLVHAERPANTEGRWRQPIQGDAGWPDLVLVRAGVMIVAELKAQRGKPRPEQVRWLAELGEVPGLVVAVWRPSDWDVIVAELTRWPGPRS